MLRIPRRVEFCDATWIVHAMSKREQSGFTLVEVLVTLVLLGMVAAILFGSLKQVIEARTRLRPYLDQSEQTTMVAGWFRQTVQGLMADYDTGPRRFAATPKDFSGLTVSPLVGPPGTPTEFHWSLHYDSANDLTILQYEEARVKTIRIVDWPGAEDSFSYYGQDQERHTRWVPPEKAESQTIPQLPRLVRLGGLPRDQFPVIVAAPRGSPSPRPLPFDLVSNASLQNIGRASPGISGYRRNGIPDASIADLAKLDCRQDRSRRLRDLDLALIERHPIMADPGRISRPVGNGCGCRAPPMNFIRSEIDLPGFLYHRVDCGQLRIRGRLRQQREPLLGGRIAPNVKPHRIELGLEHANLSLGCYYFRALQSFEQSGADQRTQHDKQFEKGEAIRAGAVAICIGI
jgi:prepilin-type N-terminal cleavage/methylation domain-containing protein